jgi:hypothetical protein
LPQMRTHSDEFDTLAADATGETRTAQTRIARHRRLHRTHCGGRRI